MLHGKHSPGSETIGWMAFAAAVVSARSQRRAGHVVNAAQLTCAITAPKSDPSSDRQGRPHETDDVCEALLSLGRVDHLHRPVAVSLGAGMKRLLSPLCSAMIVVQGDLIGTAQARQRIADVVRQRHPQQPDDRNDDRERGANGGPVMNDDADRHVRIATTVATTAIAPATAISASRAASKKTGCVRMRSPMASAYNRNGVT